MSNANEHQPPLAPDTTHQQDLTTEGQRAINLIWETTQSRIAVGVVVFTLGLDAAVIVISLVLVREISATMVGVLGFVHMVCGVVISFYFSRTNHAAIGGIGPKPVEQYIGR